MKKPKLKLYPLEFKRLHQDELAAFISRNCKDFEALGTDLDTAPEFFALYMIMKDQLPVYILAVNQIKAKAESKLIYDLDVVRDKKIVTLKTALQVYRHTEDEAEKKAYDLLSIVFRNYKDIAKDNFETETINIKKMNAELLGPKHIDAVNLLGLESRIDDLEKANQHFDKVFSKRSTTTNTTEVYDTKTLQENILESYKTMANYVLTMTPIKNDAFFDKLFFTINNIRQYYANILATRRPGDNKEQ